VQSKFLGVQTVAEQAKEKALEAYLVASARLGERRAMSLLVKLRGPRLMAHAIRLLGDREVARDMVQEAWAEILRGLGGLRDDHAFLPWALRIVSRRVAREIGQRQRHRKLEVAYADEVEDALLVDLNTMLDADKLRQALGALTPQHRATIALFYLEEMSVNEVARAMDVPAGTVKTRLMHARARLRSALLGEDE
jgi:RNA polymerase sigma-70 factor (ECF subfamily)